MTTPNSPTPRTDALVHRIVEVTWKHSEITEVIEHARTLEHELQEAKREVKELEILNRNLEFSGYELLSYATHMALDWDKQQQIRPQILRDWFKRDHTPSEPWGTKLIKLTDERDQLKQANAELAASEHKLRTVLARHSKCECEYSIYDEHGKITWGGQRLVHKCHNCKLVEEALSTPTSDALKPWVEFVNDMLEYIDVWHWARQNEKCKALVDQARELLKSVPK